MILHGTMLAAARVSTVYRAWIGQLCEIWPRSTGRTSENGERLPQEDWGYDMRDGVLTRVEGEERVEETLLTVPGNYPALCGYS